MQVNNKRNRVILTILVIISTYLFLLVFFKIIISENTNGSICIFKIIFHKDCPGCGMTRAFYNMLKLNFNKAINFNVKIILVYPLIWGLYINYAYKKINLIFKGDVKNGRKTSKYKRREN